jgi:hypothetical protein
LGQGLKDIFSEGRLQKDLFLEQVEVVSLDLFNHCLIADFGILFYDIFLYLFLVNEHIGIAFVIGSLLPLPNIDPCVVELDPLSIAFY